MKGIDHIVTKEHSGFFAWPTVFLGCAVGIGFFGSIVLTYLGFIALALCSCLNFILCYLAFTPLHEAVHNNIRGPFRQWQWIESAVGHITGTMLLGPYPCFVFLHLSHHAHTNEANHDPDMWVAGKSAWSVFWRCMSILPHYYHYFFTSQKRAARRVFWPTLLSLLTLFSLLAIAISLSSFSFILLAWILPAWFANAALAFMLDYLPHVPHNTIVRYKNTNIIYGSLIYWISMGHSYHLIHHLWPRIPFYRYKRAFLANRSMLEKEGTPIFSSFTQLFEAWRH
ncbi:MAG: Fatty acid desaturase [bacterium ADurb.BinA186]|nr:MAG: Fatty acid desaturase [bacterium ADurb.BinA186]